MPATFLIADDEPLALDALKGYLRELGFSGEILEARDGLAALRLMSERRPELAFLDIVMPGLSGLQVLEQLEYEPRIVFTTAYDQHAVTAFELGAVDYLLKPFGAERVGRVLRRVLAGGPAPETGAFDRLQSQLPSAQPADRLFVRDGRRILPVLLDELERVQGADDYVILHTRAKEHLVHLRLGDLEVRLPPARFLRVHRSHLINLAFVASIEPFDLARVQVVMASGARIVASRAGSRKLRDLAL